MLRAGGKGAGGLVAGCDEARGLGPDAACHPADLSTQQQKMGGEHAHRPGKRRVAGGEPEAEGGEQAQQGADEAGAAAPAPAEPAPKRARAGQAQAAREGAGGQQGAEEGRLGQGATAVAAAGSAAAGEEEEGEKGGGTGGGGARRPAAVIEEGRISFYYRPKASVKLGRDRVCAGAAAAWGLAWAAQAALAARTSQVCPPASHQPRTLQHPIKHHALLHLLCPSCINP